MHKVVLEQLLRFIKENKFSAVLIIVGGFISLLWLFCLPKELFRDIPYSTVVTDSNGELLGARVADDQQWRFRITDSLPDKFVKALIEFEDRGFYYHSGVSFRALARAAWQNISNKRIVSGGSTITMQVVRIFRNRERTIWQKIVEIFMATRLEYRYSKEEILRLYISNAPFGGNVVGIKAALWRYLGDGGVEISWAEAATLAVLQNAPALIHLDRNRDKLKSKRDRLLKRLYEKGDMLYDDYLLSIEEPLIGEPYPMPQYSPHLVEWYYKHNRGEEIKSSINLSLQNSVESITASWSEELRGRGARDLAAVVVDVKSGDVVAYCGNADITYDRDGRWVDIARAPRSSGSILKPLLYCAALQDGVVLPKELLLDIPINNRGFSPKNFDGTYSGAVAADEALALSLNIPSVNLLDKYGINKFVNFLVDSGLSTFKKGSRRYGPSLILGGAEVKLLDITNLYAKMSACYLDSTRYRDFPIRDRVALYYTFMAMRDVTRPDMMDWERAISVKNVAWKTGTSYGSRDGWAVGVTQDYAVGVWVGNANGESVSSLTGARWAGPILFDIFNILPYSGWFREPSADSGVDALVCSYSGMIAGRYCSSKKPMRLQKNCYKGGSCKYCVKVIAPSGESNNYFVLPTAVERYYADKHPEYMLSANIEGYVANRDCLQFVYPTSSGKVLFLPKRADGSYGGVVFEVAHINADEEIFWHIDDSYFGSTKNIHKIGLDLEEGEHVITAVDREGNSKSLSVIIKK